MLTSFMIKRRIAPTLVNFQRANFIVLAEEGEEIAKKRNKGGLEVNFTQHEMTVLQKLLKKMNTHSEILTKEPDSTDEEVLPMHDHHLHHKHHQSLKEIFSKHGVEVKPEFMRDLKHWKHS